jgi:hypothetical protein
VIAVTSSVAALPGASTLEQLRSASPSLAARLREKIARYDSRIKSS